MLLPSCSFRDRKYLRNIRTPTLEEAIGPSCPSSLVTPKQCARWSSPKVAAPWRQHRVRTRRAPPGRQIHDNCVRPAVTNRRFDGLTQ